MLCIVVIICFFFSSRRRHTRCALVTGVQTCALPIYGLVQSVRTLGTVSSAAELAQVSLPLPDGRRPRLADIATVKDTHAQRSQLALLDGKPVIGFDVMRARGHDDVGTSKGRSEERRVGKECVSTGRSRGSPDH